MLIATVLHERMTALGAIGPYEVRGEAGGDHGVRSATRARAGRTSVIRATLSPA